MAIADSFTWSRKGLACLPAPADLISRRLTSTRGCNTRRCGHSILRAVLCAFGLVA